MENGKKTSTLIIGIILLIVIVSGLTYAWLVWSKDTKIEGTSKCFDITYTGGANINANLVLVDTPISGGNIIPIIKVLVFLPFSIIKPHF